MDQEEIRIPRSDFDSFCRYRRFVAVYLSQAYKIDTREPGNEHYFSGVYIENWRCAKCHRFFELF